MCQLLFIFLNKEFNPKVCNGKFSDAPSESKKYTRLMSHNTDKKIRLGLDRPDLTLYFDTLKVHFKFFINRVISA